jgi:signal transduction histidine kinase
MRPRLLVVDDESRQMEALCRTLTPEGYDVTGYSVPEEALTALREQSFDVLLTDLMMPGMDGLALLAAALEIDPDLVGIMMTGQGSVTSAVDAMKIGALDYILKPFNLTAIRPVLARAVDVRRLRLDNIRLREAVSLHEVSTAIARSLDSGTVLARVADAALDQSGAAEVGVYLAGPGVSDLRLVASRRRAGEGALAPYLSMADPLVTTALQARDALLGRAERRAAAAPVGLAAADRDGGRRPVHRTAAVPRVHAAAADVAGQIKALSVLAGTAATALEASMLLEHLRRSNDDLRKFAWAASHDLQEPLRDVALHTQLLARRAGARRRVERAGAAAADGARRILRLVQELRTFVEAGTCRRRRRDGRRQRRARSRARELRAPIADTQAGVERGHLPVVRMREGDLVEVFRRLLDNAIKFRRPGSAPRIEIGATEGDGRWVLSVRDAGIGIDPRDHAQIFELFQRVNRREEYDGIGMGLPVCRRLVEAYGGRVWVESRPDEGARFFVSLPAANVSP